MVSNPCLKYFFIGNLLNNSIFVEYPYESEEKVQKNARTLFEKLQTVNFNKYDERLTIIVNNGYYYYTVTKAKFFFFTYTDNGYTEKLAFDFIDEIHSLEIMSMLDDKGNLNHEGFLNLKELYSKFEVKIEDSQFINEENYRNQDENDNIFDEIGIEIQSENENYDKIQEIENQIQQIKDNENNQSIINNDKEKQKLKYAYYRFLFLVIVFIICAIIYISVAISKGNGIVEKIGVNDNSTFIPSSSEENENKQKKSNIIINNMSNKN